MFTAKRRHNLHGLLLHEKAMSTTCEAFDVFSIKNNEPVWLGAAEALAQALKIAQNNGPGSYMVFSNQTEHKKIYIVDPNGIIHPSVV